MHNPPNTAESEGTVETGLVRFDSICIVAESLADEFHDGFKQTRLLK